MHYFERTTVSGHVEHVFGHRFTVKTADAVILADLTPHGARHVPLKSGDSVVIEGEQKPSEIRVESIAIGARTYVMPPPERGPHHHHGHHRHGPGHEHHPKHREAGEMPDLAAIMKRLVEDGYEVLGQPRMRHRHCEWLVRKGKELFEAHVEFDGHIRKLKPADLDGKWAGRDTR